MLFMKKIDIDRHRLQIVRNLRELQLRLSAGEVEATACNHIKSDAARAKAELAVIQAYSRKQPGYREPADGEE